MVLSILNLYLPLIFVSLAFLCFANSKKKKKKKAGHGKSLGQTVTRVSNPSNCNSGTEFLTSIHT